MVIACSPRGFMDINRPNQALNDLKNAGFGSLVLDLEMGAPAIIMEKIGKNSYKSDAHSIAVDNPQRLNEKLTAFMDRSASLELGFAIAQAPFLLTDTKQTALAGLVKALAIEGIRICGERNCPYIIIKPLSAGVNRAELWDVNRAFYLDMAGAAADNGVTILLQNQCAYSEGHLIRGICSDEMEAARWVDELNAEAVKLYGARGTDYFGFCMDVGCCNLCAQNMYDFTVTLGDRIKAVVFRDCDGHRDASMLPFTCVNKGQSQTDYLNLIRGLRKIVFDGVLVLEMGDSAQSFSPMLKPAFFSLAKQVADFLKWQIEMESMLDRYSSRVLFGAGNMCRNYIKNYGDKYPPLYTCDNNRNIWGQKFEGLEIHNPEDLRLLSEDTAIFICNIYYREIEAQLRDMGIKNPILYFNDEYMPSFNFDRWDSVTGKLDK